MFKPQRVAQADLELTLVRTRTHAGYSPMSPDRGPAPSRPSDRDRDENGDQDVVEEHLSDDDGPSTLLHASDKDAQNFLNEQAEQGQNFTLRGVLVGLAIGVIICFSNMYFGLQTGWVSGMAMPAALIGFGFFKTVARCIDYPFTPVENVLVQTVAGALGTMPLGCGFVGVMPALNYLLTPEENGPLVLSTGKLIVWSLGICFFGVVFAVPLRKEVIIREKLKFPSGTATALMIGVVHGKEDEKTDKVRSADKVGRLREASNTDGPAAGQDPRAITGYHANHSERVQEQDRRGDWKGKIRLLVYAFAASAAYVGRPPIIASSG